MTIWWAVSAWRGPKIVQFESSIKRLFWNGTKCKIHFKHARLNFKPLSNWPQNLMKKSIPRIIICSCPWCPKRECGRRRSNTVTNVAKSRFLESRKNHHLFLLLIILWHIFFKYDVAGVILRSAKTQKNAHFCPLYKCCQGDFGLIYPHCPQGMMMLVE